MTEIDILLGVLRAGPTTFNDLGANSQQFLRDFFQTNRVFDDEQRSLIDQWWLELPAERVSELDALNTGQVFIVVPTAFNGRLLIPAALLSDPIAYGHAFEFLTTLTFVETSPTDQTPLDDI